MPTIAIVGRPNVGKSQLFNRLARREISLVHDRPGVTRDRMVADCRWKGRKITLIDTGGIGLEDQEGLSEMIQHEAGLAIAAADLLFWVVDGREGMTPLDEEIGRLLRKSQRPIFVVVNKVDDPKLQNAETDFNQTGFNQIFSISAAHGLGITDLMTAALCQLPEKNESLSLSTHSTRITVAGRPNVGKSSLINAILGDTRTLVSKIAGTTRDAIEIPYQRKTRSGMEPYLLIDTAGMRQRRRILDELERSMTARSAHSIKRADICILLITADEGVTAQDKKIAGLIFQEKKPCLICVNKWDLAKGVKTLSTDRNDAKKIPFKTAFETAVRRELFFLNFAPLIFLSALEGQGMNQLFTVIDRVAKNLRTPIPTGPLNRILQRALNQQPPPIRHGKRFKILYATSQREEGRWQSASIVVFCNDTRLIHQSWLAFVEGLLRREFALEGCPIRWIWRDRQKNNTNRSTTRSKQAHG